MTAPARNQRADNVGAVNANASRRLKQWRRLQCPRHLPKVASLLLSVRASCWSSQAVIDAVEHGSTVNPTDADVACGMPDLPRRTCSKTVTGNGIAAEASRWPHSRRMLCLRGRKAVMLGKGLQRPARRERSAVVRRRRRAPQFHDDAVARPTARQRQPPAIEQPQAQFAMPPCWAEFRLVQ